MHGSVVGLTLSSKLDWGSCIVYIAKTVSKKIGALIRSTKFLSPEVALYLYKSTIPPCMEYCYWFTAASLEPLAHCRNVASLSLSYRYYFGRCHLNWLSWFHFLTFEGVLLVILIDFMIFLLPFLNVTRMSMSTISVLARLDSEILCLWNAFL